MNFFYRLKFWLTTNVVCAWCGKVKHRAPLSFLKAQTSHGICRECCAKIPFDNEKFLR